MITGYYYLHTNGSLVYKPAIVVENDECYFDSDFVKYHWSFDKDNRADAWKIILQALYFDASIPEIKELIKKWNITPDDFKFYLGYLKSKKIALGAQEFMGLEKLKEIWDDLEKDAQLRPSESIDEEK